MTTQTTPRARPSGRREFWTAVRLLDLQRRHRNGETVQDLAASYGVGERTIWRYLRIARCRGEETCLEGC